MKRPQTSKKKVLFTKGLASELLVKSSFFDRASVSLFAVDSAQEVLHIHREVQLDLIVTGLNLPGGACEDLCKSIRASQEFRNVSVIIIGRDNPEDRERSELCRANAFFIAPVDIQLFQQKVRQLMEIAPRNSYRTALAVGIQGKFKDKPMPFSTINVSASGMLIESEERLSKGEKLFFSFYLRKGTHISGYGQIARISQITRVPLRFQYGVTFTDIDPDAKAALEDMSHKPHN